MSRYSVPVASSYSSVSPTGVNVARAPSVFNQLASPINPVEDFSVGSPPSGMLASQKSLNLSHVSGNSSAPTPAYSRAPSVPNIQPVLPLPPAPKVVPLKYTIVESPS